MYYNYIECVPCDYGSYRSGAELNCTLCDGDKSTLNKGSINDTFCLSEYNISTKTH